MEPVNAIILGGGKGTRLYPLTRERAKPAVPFAGKYRLIDIPMSNCINSGFRRIYILTQFNSASLHTHLANTYSFDAFSKGVVEILAAEQTFKNSSWYEGTADAVRKNFQHLSANSPEYFIILSGDQLYRMDLSKMLDHHRRNRAQITVASTRVDRARASSLGIIQPDENYMVHHFAEKPGPVIDISAHRYPQCLAPGDGTADSRPFLGSMGMYIFNADILKKVLDNDRADFAIDIIPRAIKDYRVFTYIHDGFWEDIGTIRTFYDTNLSLATQSPEFNFYDENMPMYTRRKDLPATKMINCSVHNTIAAEGSVLQNASIMNSVVGIRTIIADGALLDGVVCLGAHMYETEAEKFDNSTRSIPNMGIGRGTSIRRCIIDMNARIGSDCNIGMGPTPPKDGDFATHSVKDGIIVIPKGAVIPRGTVI